jgi:hypothetical protein
MNNLRQFDVVQTRGSLATWLIWTDVQNKPCMTDFEGHGIASRHFEAHQSFVKVLASRRNQEHFRSTGRLSPKLHNNSKVLLIIKYFQ